MATGAHSITGGSFEGPQIKRKLFPVGRLADHPQRWCCRTGSKIYATDKRQCFNLCVGTGYAMGLPKRCNAGKGETVDQEYYFRGTPVSKLHQEHKWLTRYIFIVTGERRADRVILDFYNYYNHKQHET
jgi:hypothetical protein